MRLGLSLGYWGLGPPAAEQLALVQEAERLGFHSAWSSEAYGSDAATVLAWLAGQTSTLRLGAAVFQIPGRSAAMTAMTAATLDRLSAGRFVLGPRNTSLAAETADGWLPTLVSPEHMDAFRPALDEGMARRVGTTAPEFDIAPVVNVCIDDDLEAARNAMRPQLALYIGGMGSREKNFYNRLVCAYGFEAAAGEVQALYLAGRTKEAEAALPGGLIDAVTIVGPRDRARDRLASYRAAGVGTLIVWPMGDSAQARREQLRLVADLAS